MILQTKRRKLRPRDIGGCLRSHSTAALLLKYPKQQESPGTQPPEPEEFLPSQANPAFLHRADEKVFAHQNATLPPGSGSDVVSFVKPFCSLQPESIFSHDLCPGLGCNICPVLPWTVSTSALFPVLNGKLLGRQAWLVSFCCIN